MWLPTPPHTTTTHTHHTHLHWPTLAHQTAHTHPSLGLGVEQTREPVCLLRPYCAHPTSSAILSPILVFPFIPSRLCRHLLHIVIIPVSRGLTTVIAHSTALPFYAVLHFIATAPPVVFCCLHTAIPRHAATPLPTTLVHSLIVFIPSRWWCVPLPLFRRRVVLDVP